MPGNCCVPVVCGSQVRQQAGSYSERCFALEHGLGAPASALAWMVVSLRVDIAGTRVSTCWPDRYLDALRLLGMTAQKDG